MSRKVLLIVTGVVVAALAAVAVLFVVSRGSGDAEEAVLDHVADRGSDADVLVQQDWGDGQLVLVGYDRRGVRRLGLAFASEGMLGWRVSSYTEETVEPDDVVVGSLLIASSEGSDGQPSWTAAAGELTDTRIERVEMEWDSGDKSVAPRNGSAYLVVQEGTTTAKEARYLAEDGSLIAPVPVDEG